MIEKRVGIVVSGGRTATAFFGRFLSDLIADSWSVHEPDVWIGAAHARSWRALRWFGPYHALVGKVVGTRGMRNASENFLSGRWSREATVQRVLRQRQRFYAARAESLIFESNYQWYGLLPLIPDIFQRYRVAALVRDPRTWISSWIAHGGRRDVRDILPLFGQRRLAPGDVGEDVPDWDALDTFGRLCWDWRYLNSLLLDSAQKDPHIRIFRYEDLLLAEDRAQHQEALLDFFATWPKRSYPYTPDELLFETRVNRSTAGVHEEWQIWPESKRRLLRDMCGDLMRRLGYETGA